MAIKVTPEQAIKMLAGNGKSGQSQGIKLSDIYPDSRRSNGRVVQPLYCNSRGGGRLVRTN
jgi:hypothetical protein